jgi:hypothetical protein
MHIHKDIKAYSKEEHAYLHILCAEEASNRLRRRMFYVMFGGKTEGWKFETAVHQAFQRTDLDGSGMLDKDELRMAFENMDMYLSHAQIDELVYDFDQDGDHRFDADEFRYARLRIEQLLFVVPFVVETTWRNRAFAVQRCCLPCASILTALWEHMIFDYASTQGYHFECISSLV